MKLSKISTSLLVSGVTLLTVAPIFNGASHSVEAATNWTPRSVQAIRQDLKTTGIDKYTIKWGDTLSTISAAAKLNGVDVSIKRLAEINHISNVDLIETGNTLLFKWNGVNSTVIVKDKNEDNNAYNLDSSQPVKNNDSIIVTKPVSPDVNDTTTAPSTNVNSNSNNSSNNNNQDNSSNTGNTNNNQNNGSNAGNTNNNQDNGSNTGNTNNNQDNGSKTGNTNNNQDNGSKTGNTNNNQDNGSNTGNTNNNQDNGSNAGNTNNNQDNGSNTGNTNNNQDNDNIDKPEPTDQVSYNVYIIYSQEHRPFYKVGTFTGKVGDKVSYMDKYTSGYSDTDHVYTEDGRHHYTIGNSMEELYPGTTRYGFIEVLNAHFNISTEEEYMAYHIKEYGYAGQSATSLTLEKDKPNNIYLMFNAM
ncbi:LysM peptidoglycan-binding domain-containing protein [Latilactobacillus sakei]|uniref:LysM peptidoglycan-binding domain-containing protein n=1 Tax=Latilactobacillus sakei TaxID=1599 RepID=UPI003F539209